MVESFTPYELHKLVPSKKGIFRVRSLFSIMTLSVSCSVTE